MHNISFSSNVVVALNGTQSCGLHHHRVQHYVFDDTQQFLFFYFLACTRVLRGIYDLALLLLLSSGYLSSSLFEIAYFLNVAAGVYLFQMLK